MKPASGKSIKKKLREDMALIGRAVGHPVRLELLDLLDQGGRTVEVLARKSHQSVANVSRHLGILYQSGLVEKVRRGNFIEYNNTPEVYRLLENVSATAVQALPSAREVVRTYFDAKDELSQHSLPEILTSVRKGDTVLIDVRPRDEFDSGHIPAALAVPLDELARIMRELPADKEIVAYCRGPYCVLAVEAVRMLRARGLRAFRLNVGYPQWREYAAGLPD